MQKTTMSRSWVSISNAQQRLDSLLFSFSYLDPWEIPVTPVDSSSWHWCLLSSVQLLSRVWLFVTPWISACQASLSITNSRSSLKLMCIESVMPSSHLILCHPLLLLPPIPPSIRVFSNESTLCMWWPNYWSFSFSIIPSRKISRDIVLEIQIKVWVSLVL